MNQRPMSETPSSAYTPPQPAEAPPSKPRRSPLPLIVAAGVVLLIAFIVVGLFLAARPAPDQVQGMVEAETFTVATKVPSRVERFLAAEGDQVKAGQELALMSSPEVEAKDAQARALLQSTEAIQSMSREGARAEDVQTVESIWRASQAAARLADQTARRAENLFAEGVISAQRRDEAVAARAATASQTEAARQQYLKALAGTRPQEKSVADANVSGARAAVAEVESLQGETRLTAPRRRGVGTLRQCRRTGADGGAGLHHRRHGRSLGRLQRARGSVPRPEDRRDRARRRARAGDQGRRLPRHRHQPPGRIRHLALDPPVQRL